jgi:aryl-alcohol dehydrogenase-like predicted oxidoreductase
VGAALKKFQIPRERIVIMTKIFYALDPEGQSPIAANMDRRQNSLSNRVGLSRKHVLAAVAESVKRLGTYIDVLQIHRLDRETPVKEIMKALNDVVESGQVRYLGASSMSTWEFQKLQYTAETHGWHKFISMQNYYNLLNREEEREMIPFCRDSSIGLIPWSPLARGVLARAWSSHTKREESDNLLRNLVRESATTADEEVVTKVEELAKKKGIPMAGVALGWALQKQVYPIAGLGSTQRIDEAIDALKIVFSDDEIASLESPYKPKEVQY